MQSNCSLQSSRLRTFLSVAPNGPVFLTASALPFWILSASQFQQWTMSPSKWQHADSITESGSPCLPLANCPDLTSEWSCELRCKREGQGSSTEPIHHTTASSISPSSALWIPVTLLHSPCQVARKAIPDMTSATCYRLHRYCAPVAFLPHPPELYEQYLPQSFWIVCIFTAKQCIHNLLTWRSELPKQY